MTLSRILLLSSLITLCSVTTEAVADFPNPPTNVQASDGSSTAHVAISWEAPASGDPVVSYKVYRSTNNLFCSGSPLTTVGATSFQDTTATPSLIYYYSVRSVGADALESNCSNTDSGYRAELPPPLPPENLSATTNLSDKIALTWQLPLTGQSITGIQVFRSITQTVCVGDPIATLGTPLTSYDDLTANPGQVYYYSLKSSGPTGISACSSQPIFGFRLDPPPPLPPAAVQASDGTFEDKIRVNWVPPVGSSAITNYRLYRSPTPALCTSLLQTGIAPSNQQIDDSNSVVPGRLYYYSVDSLGPNGESTCSNVDPGYAQISPPIAVSATDGTFPEKVVVTWQAPSLGGDITGYELYKSNSPASCSNLIAGNLSSSTFSFTDNNVSSGTLYYYSLKTVSPTGSSICSTIDSGFPTAPICSNGLDDDQDGLADLADPGCLGNPNRNTEKNVDGPLCDNGIDDDSDGSTDFRVDGSGDIGCTSVTDDTEDDASTTALKSPAYIKFNTYLGQWNYAELINQGTKDKVVDVTIYNLRGEAMISRSYVVPANSQNDIDVNSLLVFACEIQQNNCEGFEDLSATQGAENGLGRPDGVVDTYGLVRLDFDDTDPDEQILGRMSFYRPNGDESFSFAFAREFKNPLNGPSYATSNTYDPQGLGYLVPNWAEVINLAATEKTFTLNIYAQDGRLKFTRSFSLPPLGEFDFHAGHEFLKADGTAEENVFLVEVVPSDPKADYSFSVSRYSSNAPGGTVFDPATYNFAFSVEATVGTKGPVYAPIANVIPEIADVDARVSVTNWVEVMNTANVAANLLLQFRDASGAVVSEFPYSLAAKSQYHFNAGAILPKSSTGSVRIVSDQPVIVQGLSYVHGPENELQSGFASTARTAGRKDQAGSINTYIDMQNVLTLVTTANTTVDAEFDITSFGGTTISGALTLGNAGASALQLSNNQSLAFPNNTYGALIFRTETAKQVVGEVRRIRVLKGGIDFVMPTALK